jgi:hypothetical protein
MNGMLSEIKELRFLSKAYFIVMLLLVCSIVLNNAMNSICIMLLLAVWLVERSFKTKWHQLKKEPFFILNIIVFVFYLIGLGLSKDKGNAGFFVTKNLSLLIIPTVILSIRNLSTSQIYILLKAFVLCVFMQMLVETFLSVIKYCETRDASYFIYHKLVSNIEMGGAIVASFFCTLSIAFLFYLPNKGMLKWLLYATFSVWIILLDSKMFLATLLLLFMSNQFIKLSRTLKITSLALIITSLILLAITNNPIKQRFMDMNHFNKSYLTAKTFNQGMYFDGLSLRLIYIKFGLEIMHENGNYILGAGTGDAENLLRKKIIAYNMYTGNGTTEKEGYLKYGYHNEYLQRLVQFGFAGFGIFMASIFYCYYMAIKHRQKLLLSLMIILTCSFFTDTLLEHQIGLASYLVFACLCIVTIRNKQAIYREENILLEHNFNHVLESVK